MAVINLEIHNSNYTKTAENNDFFFFSPAYHIDFSKSDKK